MKIKTFTLDGAFDEGLVGLISDGKSCTSADFISAINSGEKLSSMPTTRADKLFLMTNRPSTRSLRAMH